MMQFKAFKPQALNKIAGAMGYQGDMSQFQKFIEEDPQRKAQMDRYTNAARMMARGGVVRMQTGGTITPGGGSGGIIDPATSGQDVTGQPVTDTPPATPTNIGDFTTGQVFNPALPEGGKVDAVKMADTVDPRTEVAEGTGKIEAPAAVDTQLAGTATAQQPEEMQANLVDTETSSEKVNTALDAVEAAII